MVTLREFVGLVDAVIPFSRAAMWDEVGLQIGDPEADVAVVGVCHEVSDIVLAETESGAADVLVTYHPLLFRPTTRFVAGPTPAGRGFALARMRCGLLSVHTAFDAAPGGTSDALASVIGLADTEAFGVPAEEEMIGRLGRVGPTTLGDFEDAVAAAVGSSVVRRAGRDDWAIERVAVVPGSGAEFVMPASAAGADVLVTGDVSHHRAIEALDRGLAVIDAGHAATERPGMVALVDRVEELGFEVVDLTAIGTDPWVRRADETGTLAERTVPEGR